MHRVLKKIRQDDKEFVLSEELQDYCKDFYVDHRTIGDYLLTRGYLLNILDNIYYVKTEEEILQNKLKYSILELVAKGLDIKKVKNWYFGLYTALTLNNVEYEQDNEYFYLINDQILKAKPTKILGKDFRFLTFKDVLFNFGIINNKIKYSDHEKTILDLIYLWQYNNKNESRILIETAKLIKGISEEKLLKYSEYYPESNRTIVKKALNKLQITH
ncbi:MAG: hypothetical protein V3V33_09675 [Candidatus Lokiarchaeia archaeon]